MAYRPDIPPSDNLQALAQFVQRELWNIAAEFEQVDTVILVERHEEPAKPRLGLVVFADGTNWNPGSGRGFYGYDGTTWKFLG